MEFIFTDNVLSRQVREMNTLEKSFIIDLIIVIIGIKGISLVISDIVHHWLAINFLNAKRCFLIENET